MLSLNVLRHLQAAAPHLLRQAALPLPLLHLPAAARLLPVAARLPPAVPVNLLRLLAR